MIPDTYLAYPLRLPYLAGPWFSLPLEDDFPIDRLRDKEFGKQGFEEMEAGRAGRAIGLDIKLHSTC